MKSQAVELSSVVSKSLVRRRFRPSQAKVFHPANQALRCPAPVNTSIRRTGPGCVMALSPGILMEMGPTDQRRSASRLPSAGATWGKDDAYRCSETGFGS